MSLPLPVSLALETAINAALRLDPDTRDNLTAIDGKTIRINVRQPNVSVLLGIVDRRIHLIDHSDEQADTTISGTLGALKTLGSANDALYQGEVTVDGDMGVAQHLRDILAGLDPDWQDAISPLLGDTLTHHLDRAQQHLSQWIKRSRHNAHLNTSEYLQEEIKLVAPSSEVIRFCEEVDELRAAADRVDARLKQLENSAHTDTPGLDTC